MPNLLAIECPADFVLSMSQTENWTVMAGVYENVNLPKELRGELRAPPDPTDWNLLVDDSKRQPSPDWPRVADEGIPLVLIPYNYIQECHRAHAIRICNDKLTRLAHWKQIASQGYRSLEFNAAPDSRASYLSDFIEAFEADFWTGRLDWFEVETEYEALYSDVYRDPVVVLAEEAIQCLMTLDIPDPNRRSEALIFLRTRTAPELWGDLFSNHFFPAEVVALKEQRDKLLAESRAELARLDMQIEEGQAKYAPYVNLLYIGDDALKDLVAGTFRDVFGAKVQDLDTTTADGEPKRLDLDVNLGGTTLCVEVRGRANRNAQIDDIEKFERNLELMTNGAKYEAKLLVFNGMYRRTDEERGRVQTFSNDIVEEAMAVKIGLLSTGVLLGLVEARIAGKLSDSDLIERLSTPGVIT